jgi:hypothetical protein
VWVYIDSKIKITQAEAYATGIYLSFDLAVDFFSSFAEIGRAHV